MFMTLGLKASHLQVQNMTKWRFFKRLDAQRECFLCLVMLFVLLLFS